MYDYEYEEDVLLTLRLLKYLQEESPARAQEAVEAFKTLVPEDPYEFIEYTFWDIFTDITFASDEAEELTIATFFPSGNQPILCAVGASGAYRGAADRSKSEESA